jgi:hypothetical protein
MADQPTTPAQPPTAAKASADKPAGATPEEPKSAPWGPGPLMFFGLAFLGLAVYCFYDLFIGEAGEKWAKEGAQYTILFNWAGMLVGIGGAGYSFVMALVRSRTPAEKP